MFLFVLVVCRVLCVFLTCGLSFMGRCLVFVVYFVFLLFGGYCRLFLGCWFDCCALFDICCVLIVVVCRDSIVARSLFLVG